MIWLCFFQHFRYICHLFGFSFPEISLFWGFSEIRWGVEIRHVFCLFTLTTFTCLSYWLQLPSYYFTKRWVVSFRGDYWGLSRRMNNSVFAREASFLIPHHFRQINSWLFSAIRLFERQQSESTAYCLFGIGSRESLSMFIRVDIKILFTRVLFSFSGMHLDRLQNFF